MAWKKTLEEMTSNKATTENRPDNLPIGYIVKKEPKATRRSFAMQQSVLDALAKIAAEKGTNLNALVNDVLTAYVSDYLKED